VRPDRRALLAALLAGGLPLAGRAQFRLQRWPAGTPAPALPSTDIQGSEQRLAALKGRVVLVNFWATWCGPCKEEMPTLQTLAELEGERIAVLAVNSRERPATVRRYLAATQLKLPVLLDPRGEATRAWQVEAFPTTILIDTAGQPRLVVIGAVDWTGQDAARWIDALGERRT